MKVLQPNRNNNDNKVEIGIVDGAQIANLTVTGTFTPDDITPPTVNVDGDAVITGNLTVPRYTDNS